MDLLTAGDHVPRRRFLLGLAGVGVGGLAAGRLAVAGPPPAALASCAGVVYFGGHDRRLHALRAGDGALLWSSQTGGGQYTGPVAARGVVYFGGRDLRLYALRAADGVGLWSSAAGGGPTGATPVVTAGAIYYGSFDNRMYALAV